jgi:hypothetical protein
MLPVPAATSAEGLGVTVGVDIGMKSAGKIWGRGTTSLAWVGLDQ